MDFVDIAREFLILVSSDLDPHTSKKGVVKVNGNNSVSLFTPSHIQFAKYGRGPGKMPPINNIERWLKEKGIITDPKEARGTAFAIAKSISKKGTANYKPNAPNAIEEALTKHFTKFNSALAESIKVSVENELVEVYDNIQFKKIKI